MPKPFDTTLNSLIDLREEDWARCFAQLAGIPPGPCKSLDTDLSTSLQADRIFRIDGPKPSLLHLELEGNPRLGIPHHLLRYNVLSSHGHQLPVETVLVLLRPKAVASDLTGRFRQYGVSGNLIVDFRYHVVRVWEFPVQFWLDAGIGLAPLGLLTNEAEQNLEQAVDRMESCFRELNMDQATIQSLIGSSYILCGLRYEPERIAEAYRRMAMLLEDSTTYQEILQKGECKGEAKGIAKGIALGVVEGEHKSLILLGTERFGPPSDEMFRSLTGINDLQRLETLLIRSLRVSSWEELLKDN